MKISAIDIRKHTFEKIFRGYDPDEVDAFLNSLSQEWERFSSENGLLKMQLEYAEKELSKLKDIESTLFRTLKSAEDVSRQIEKEANEQAVKTIDEANELATKTIEEANDLATKTIGESKVKADEMILEAEQRTGQVVSETEDKLKRFREEFVAEVKIQERDFRAIENFRDNLVVQLASLANNTIDTVERFEQKYDKDSVLNKMDEIKQHILEIEIPRKPLPKQEVQVENKEEEITDTDDVQIVLSDEKPEVAFEIIDYHEDEEAEIAEPEIELTPEQEPELVEAAAELSETTESETREKVKSAADAASEALAEMHRVAQKARDETPAINKLRNQENNQSNRGGGGSFFDQI
ncbi:DivIVA domain-containing protein [Dyadobacter sp. NIV53]|uniref:DivIVA domain-containing protein n=1 Tax=Dyadobacter sp. NIV53 TaxID=2861765 RepID=UPI001C8799AC|nr:DivIVA domain-containing protein [Dyadobacter sp. NIV53]